jgi:hypothetical protein
MQRKEASIVNAALILSWQTATTAMMGTERTIADP